jgi:sugar phosphate isomerase/epimerase
MKFAICNEIFRDWPLADAMAYAAKVGYRAIELAPFTLAPLVTEISAAEREKIRALSAQFNLPICGLHWVLAQTENFHLTHPDSATRTRTARYLIDLVDCCADLGGEVIVVGSPKQRSLLPGVTPAQAWDYATTTFREAVQRAEQRRITICLEPLSPAETDFINTAADALRFVQPFNSPNFQIILDVKAMCSEAKPIPQIIAESAPRFAHFHANDANLKGPGFGAVDFHPIAAALKKASYQGHVSVEVFNFDEGPEIIATQSLEYLQRVFS